MAEYHCKLSPDHMEIIISNDHAPISLKHILEVKTISKESSSPGRCSSVCVCVCSF